MAKYSLIYGISLCILWTLPAQHFIPKDTRSEWRVAIINPSYLEAGRVFRGMGSELQSFLSLLDEKILDEEEISSLRKVAKERTAKEVRDTIQNIRAKMDRLLFEDISNIQRKRKRRLLEKELKDAQEALVEVAAYPEEEIGIVVHRSLTLEVVENISSEAHDIGTFARERAFDQVLSFRIDRIDELSYLSVSLYNSLTEKQEVIIEEFLSLQERSFYSQSLATKIAPFLVGFSVSSIHVMAMKHDEEIARDAGIYINGGLSGYGEASQLFRESGELEVAIQTPDGEYSQHTLSLQAGEIRELYVHREYTASDFIDILSLPPGAAVYHESIRVGQTPLQVVRPFESQYFELQLAGYHKKPLVLAPDSSELVMLNLDKSSEDFVKILENKRKKFYTSLALLAFSIPLPIAFSALYQEREFYLNLTSATIAASAVAENRTYYTAYYATFWTTLGITLSLSGYMLYRLIDYIRTAR